MTRTFLPTLAILPAVAIAAPALKDKPSVQPLVGVWERTGHMQDGMPLAPDNQVHRQTFTAEGEWSYSYGGKANGRPTKFTTDRKRNPPTFDIYCQETLPADYRGIYKIEGDTLTLYFVMAGDKERPKTFESSVEKPCYVWIFKRVKVND